VLITGLALGVPLSPLLALWAAVWSLVPQIGGAIGGITFVAVALTQGVTEALVAGAVFMVYLVFANNVLLPVIIGRAVDISALSTMAATIVGFTLGGIVGAMVAVPLVGAGKAMVVELRNPGASRRLLGSAEPQPPGNLARLRARFGHGRPAAS
jgi:predicted PurR-regulated permease PerM